MTDVVCTIRLGAAFSNAVPLVWRDEASTITAEFRNRETAALVDVSGVTARLWYPGGAEVSPAPTVTESEAGIWTVSVTPGYSGLWQIEFACTSPDSATAAFGFQVRNTEPDFGTPPEPSYLEAVTLMTRAEAAAEAAENVAGGVAATRTLTAGTGLAGGGDLSADRTLSLSAGSVASLALADSAVQPARTLTAGTGLAGGGNLSADRTFSLSSGSVASLALADSAVQPARSISAGTGLAGGGNLSADRTLSLSAGSVASLALADSAIQPADLVAASRVIWVDPAGADTAPGDVPTAPKRTIAAALGAAVAGDVIRVRAGAYTEICPLIVPRDVSIVGDGLRVVTVRPTSGTAGNTMFLVDSGAYLTGMTFAGHQAGAWAVAFHAAADNTALGASGAGAFILKSPYIQNCTSYTAQDDGGLAGSTSDGTTGGGLEVDGAKCAANSPIRSMVVDSFTQINLDGPGCLVTNDAYAQLVSFFGTFCSYHVKALNGGQVNLSNSTTDFGTYGLVADGRSTTPIFTGQAAAASAGANQITVTSLTTNRLGASNRPASGMVFDVGGNTYTVIGATPTTGGFVVTFYPLLAGTLAGGDAVSVYLRSQIATGGHVMEYVGAGTNYLALPWNGGVPVPANEVVELNGGRVFYSTTDQLGNFRVGPQFDVDGTTGAVTINTTSFNISGLNFIGPFSRDGGFSSVGVQLREVSNNTTLLASTGAADGNTVPTQFAVVGYLTANYTPLTRTLTAGTGLAGGGNLSADRTLSLSTGSVASLALADSAVQPARSISAGTGLTGGGNLSADRTLALADTAVSPGSYGSASAVGTFTVDAQGRLTAAGTASITPGGIGAAATAHAHVVADVTGLQTALDAKLDDSQASAFGLTLLDDADAAAARTTLGAAALGANTFTGAQNLADNELVRPLIRDYAETVATPAISSGTLTLNLEDANVFSVSLNAAITTLTISNPPASGRAGSLTLILTADGTARAVTWGAAVKWPAATPPTLSSANGARDVIVMTTLDAGTSWLAIVAGQAF